MNHLCTRPAAVAAAVLAIAGLGVTAVHAAPLSATGNPVGDGWGSAQGNSTQAGTFVQGPGLNGAPYNFDVFATTYTLQAGSNLVGGSWLVGDTVLGLGAVMQQTYDVTFRAVLKFGGAASQYAAATQNIGSCSGAACGSAKGSHSSGNGGEGSVQIGFNYVRTNGDIAAGLNGTLVTTENFRYYDNGDVNHDGNAAIRDLARIVADFDTVGNDRVLTWEGLLNVSAMARNGAFVGNDLPSVGAKSIITFQRSNGSEFTDALANAVQAAAVPAPPTLPLALLAIGTLVLAQRRRTSGR